MPDPLCCCHQTDFSREFSETTEHAPALLEEFNPRRPDMFFDNFYDETATKENMLNIINDIHDGTSEIMCHPGYVDDAFAKESILQLPARKRIANPHRSIDQRSH